MTSLKMKVQSQANAKAPTKSSSSTLIVPVSTRKNGSFNKVAQLYPKIKPTSSEINRDAPTPFCKAPKDAVPRLGGQVVGSILLDKLSESPDVVEAQHALCMLHLARINVARICTNAQPDGICPDVLPSKDYFEALEMFEYAKVDSDDPLLHITTMCRATLNPEATALHYDDILGSTALEWSIAQSCGTPDLNVTAPKHAVPSTLAPGGVYLYRYKIASINIELEVVDHLCCTRTLHGSRPAEPSPKII